MNAKAIPITDAVNHPLDAEGEAERRAMNRAFRAMGLPWYWEVSDYRELRDSGDTASRVRRYVETRHAALLTAYDAEFLGRMVSGILERVILDDMHPAPALQLVGGTSGTHSSPPANTHANPRVDPRGWSPGSHSVDYIA